MPATTETVTTKVFNYYAGNKNIHAFLYLGRKRKKTIKLKIFRFISFSAETWLEHSENFRALRNVRISYVRYKFVSFRLSCVVHFFIHNFCFYYRGMLACKAQLGTHIVLPLQRLFLIFFYHQTFSSFRTTFNLILFFSIALSFR